MMTTPIFKHIEAIVQDVPGWTPVDQLYTLFNLLYASDMPGDVIEIGSWCGRATVVLASAARLVGNTRVFAIDLFPERGDWKQNPDGTFSLVVDIGGKIYNAFKSHTLWAEPYYKDVVPLYAKHNGILDIFNEVMHRYQLQDIVRPQRGDSDFCQSLSKQNVRCKLAFIDGDHDYAATRRDIKNVELVLAEGGWICFDDAYSYYDGVIQAIEELIVQNPNYELQQQMTRKFFVARRKYAQHGAF